MPPGEVPLRTDMAIYGVHRLEAGGRGGPGDGQGRPPGSIDSGGTARTYRKVNGGRCAALVRQTLCRARELGHLAPGADVDVLQEILAAAVLAHVGTHPDGEETEEIRTYLRRILGAAGYRWKNRHFR